MDEYKVSSLSTSARQRRMKLEQNVAYRPYLLKDCLGVLIVANDECNREQKV
jgi:hypothetical protein